MFGKKDEKEFEEEMNIAIENNPILSPSKKAYNRDELLITPEDISELNKLLEKARSAGFKMAVRIENDELKLMFRNELISIDSDTFLCENIMEVPTGVEASEKVTEFSKGYSPKEEIKKLQKEVLDRNEALSVESVQKIEDKIASTIQSINALSSALYSMHDPSVSNDRLNKLMTMPDDTAKVMPDGLEKLENTAEIKILDTTK
jgi:hypothetical protein